MNFNFFKPFHWRRPKLTPEQEIVAGREIAAKGRDYYRSLTLSTRQKVMLAVIGLIFLVFMIETFPFPVMLISVTAVSAKIISHLLYDSKAMRWFDEMVFKYAAPEAARTKSRNISKRAKNLDNGGEVRPYSGVLTLEQATNGMNTALRNANRLIGDAKVLLAGDRHASAIALAILAIEEHGKVAVLRHLVGYNDEAYLRKGWAAYRNHLEKSKHWNVPYAVALGMKTHSEITKFISKNTGDSKELDSLKQSCFYTACFGGNFVEPALIFNKEQAEGIVAGFEVTIKSSKDIVAREVELYVEYVINKLVSTGVSDVRGYYKALANEGLFGMAPEEIDAFFGDSKI